MRQLGRQLLIAAILAVLAGGGASAQLSNKPFSFGNNRPGVGMSIGGRQAILNERFTGATPDVLIRDARGELLDIDRTRPGHAAVVSRPGGNFIPGFRRADWKGGNLGISVGAFNAFFVTRRDDSGGFILIQGESGAMVNTWTSRVVSDAGGIVYRADSPVDVWTGQVSGLGGIR